MRYFLVTKDEKLAEVIPHEGFLGDQLEDKTFVAIPTAMSPLCRKLILEALQETDEFAFYITIDFRFHVDQNTTVGSYTLEAHCRGWDAPAIYGEPIRSTDDLFRVMEKALENLKVAAKEKMT